MFCGNCGKQIPDGSGFCPSCGAAAGAAGSAGASTNPGAPSAAAAQRAKIEAQLKAGSQDAMQALKVLAMDPVGGLPKSFQLFDEGRALVVGLIFGAIFALAMMLAAARGASGLMFLGEGMGATANPGDLTPAQIEAMARNGFAPPSTFTIMMKALLAGAIFAAALMGSAILAKIVFKGTSKTAADVYTAGASLLPLSIFMLVALALGVGNYQIIALVMVFALCYTVLMLYNGLGKIAGISDGKAALAVPIVLVISMFVFGLVTRSLM